jgi:hypothetical protein
VPGTFADLDAYLVMEITMLLSIVTQRRPSMVRVGYCKEVISELQ